MAQELFLFAAKKQEEKNTISITMIRDAKIQ